MPRIKVIFFGDLRRLGAEREIEVGDAARVADIAQAVGIAEPTGLLIVVNGKTAPLDAAVNDGDEVAFFPRVAGGAA